MTAGSTCTVLEHAGSVYAATVAACRHEQIAEAITERVVTSALRSNGWDASLDRSRLIEQAVVLAVRVDPCPALARLPVEEREAIALARLAGCSVQEIALALETGVDHVKAAMSRTLRHMSASPERGEHALCVSSTSMG
jgi:DNA-binding NarL/FixJ family response regulator